MSYLVKLKCTIYITEEKGKPLYLKDYAYD